MLLLLCLGASGCVHGKGGQKTTENTGTEPFSKTDFVMDTVLSETLYGSEDRTEEIKKLLSALETEQLSWRKDDSVAAQINKKCSRGEKVVIGEDFARWTKDSLKLAEKSQGAFDPTIGNLTRLWNIEGEKSPRADRKRNRTGIGADRVCQCKTGKILSGKRRLPEDGAVHEKGLYP